MGIDLHKKYFVSTIMDQEGCIKIKLTYFDSHAVIKAWQ
ncbi:hypothetical protein HKBW3S42_01356, partial [Candidatus Hakubella thermalkaliphila]